MEIRNITTTAKFDSLTEDWRTLAVWNFGPLADLEDDESAKVLVAMVDDQAVAYLIADGSNLWHVETKSDHGGNGYARQLAAVAGIEFAYEVCSDAGAAFCDAIDIEFEDCRE